MSNQGKRILITGGATGYGYGMAKVLRSQGAEVWITGRRKEKLEAVAKELDVKAIVADATSPKDWDRVFSELGGRLDVLVNNAGGGHHIAEVWKQGDEEILASVQTNLLSAIYGSKRAAELFRGKRDGLIVNISSICEEYGWPGFGAYSAAKAGLLMFSKVLHAELRPFDVRVSVVTPSWGETEFNDALANPFPAGEKKKVMSPEEMGRLVAWLCEFPKHMVIPHLKVQPMVQELIPF